MMISPKRLRRIRLAANSFMRNCKLEVEPFPRRIFVELTNACNLRCPMCPRLSMRRPVRHMSERLFQQVVEEIAQERPDIPRLSFHMFGESLLHPGFFEMVDFAGAKLPATTLSVSSNANMLTEDRVRQLVGSRLDAIALYLDALSPEVYDRQRTGGNVQQAQENVRRLLEVKRQTGRTKPRVRVGAVMTALNRNEIGGFVRFWQKQVADVPGAEVVLTPGHDFGGQVKSNMGLHRSTLFTFRVGCARPFYMACIYSDGGVTLCCYDVNGALRVGSIRGSTLKEVWNSDMAVSIREYMNRLELGRLPICRHCHVTNRPLRTILQPARSGEQLLSTEPSEAGS